MDTQWNTNCVDQQNWEQIESSSGFGSVLLLRGCHHHFVRVVTMVLLWRTYLVAHACMGLEFKKTLMGTHLPAQGVCILCLRSLALGSVNLNNINVTNRDLPLMSFLHLLIVSISSAFGLLASLCKNDPQTVILCQDDRSLSPEQYLLRGWQSSQRERFQVIYYHFRL